MSTIDLMRAELFVAHHLQGVADRRLPDLPAGLANLLRHEFEAVRADAASGQNVANIDAAYARGVREGLEKARARAQQSACLCALMERHVERRPGTLFGVEVGRHISDCPAAIEADLRALIAALPQEGGAALLNLPRPKSTRS